MFIGTILLNSLLIPLAQAMPIPQLGIDYKYWNTQANSIYAPTFPKLTHGANLYMAQRLNPNFGIELGYMFATSQLKNYRITGGEEFKVIPNDPGGHLPVNLKLRSWQTKLIYYLPLKPNFEVLGYIGAAYLKPHSKIDYHSSTGSHENIALTTPGRWLGRFGLGAQYQLTKYLSVRGLLSFDPTRRIQYFSTDTQQKPIEWFPYKGSTSFELGLLIHA